MTDTFTGLTNEEIARYSRHLLIPEVGAEGQRKLKQASVLLIGAGGLGSPAALYLAAAGIGRIGLVDQDTVDSSNLQRQILHGTSQMGRAKVDSGRERLLDLNPFIQIDPYQEVFQAANAEQIAEEYDLILDGSDNFSTRYLANDLCVKTEKPYIFGAVFRFEGQVSVFDAHHGPCYRCVFPNPPLPGSVPSCAEAGVLGVVPGIIGTIQAAEAIKLILGAGEPLYARMILFDALEMSFREVRLKKNPRCQVCGIDRNAIQLTDFNIVCSEPKSTSSLGAQTEITPQDLHEWMLMGKRFRLIDIREEGELQISRLPGAEWIPYDTLMRQMIHMDKDAPVIIFCRSGVRSMRMVDQMLKAGFKDVRHLVGGINAWAKMIDPTMRIY
ncbi:MAG TPA: molybdopterin-synthase adenylyltransferase MoeB [Anaerolineaceae bacterium]